jgi:signal transduction histidine kinase
MNVFIIAGLLIAFTNFTFGIFVYWKGQQVKANKIWALFCFSVAMWGFSTYKIGVITDESAALFWYKISHIFIILNPILFWHYVKTFLEIKRTKTLLVHYILGGFFIYVNLFTDSFISGTRWAFDSFYYNTPGIYYYFMVFFFILSVAYSHYELYKTFKNSTGMRRLQIKYFFLATVAGFGCASFSFLPVFEIDVYPILDLVVPLYPIIMAYAIVRYRLMDIGAALKKGFVYFTSAIFAYIVFYLSIILFQSKWANVFTQEGYLFGILIALVFAATFPVVQKLAQSFANRYLYVNVYNTQQTLKNLSNTLTTLVDLDGVLNSITTTIMRTLGSDKVGIIIKNMDKQGYKIAKMEAFDNRLISSADKKLLALTELFGKEKQIIALDELEIAIKTTDDEQVISRLKKIKTEMNRFQVSICLPLRHHEELVGVILLGNKASNEPYSQDDLYLLGMVANQAAIALENSQLYNKMEKIIKAQTKELRHKNRNLQELLEAKTTFLSIASHQLRTPISIVNGMLSMLVEGSVPENKKAHFIQRALDNIKHVNETINDLLSTRAVEGKNLKIKKTPTQIDDLISEIVDERMVRAKEKNLDLIYNKPKDPTPLINIDEHKITEVVANLVDNAIQYTTEGSININTHIENKRFFFIIKDTGIGIKKADIPKLFKKISRLPDAIQIRPKGTGLGLFIVKSIVEAHGGDVEVRSEGIPGKGSKFIFSLPIK